MTDEARSLSPDLAPWGVCEIRLVADRTHGATHKFFFGWRFEAVLLSGRPQAGTTLFVAPLDSLDVVESGWRYDLHQEAAPREPRRTRRTVFSWTASNSPTTPDPLTAAHHQVQTWLAAHDWEQDPMNPSRYHG